jgi:hypothetical protein
VIISVVYLTTRCLLGCLTVLTRRQLSKDAELLVFRHENAVLRRQVSRVRYQPGDRLWLAPLRACTPRQQGRGQFLRNSTKPNCFGADGGISHTTIVPSRSRWGNVQAPVPVDYRFVHLLHLRLDRYVSPYRGAPRSQLGDRAVQLGLAAAGDHDARALVDEFLGDPQAYSLVGASYDGDLPGQGSVQHRGGGAGHSLVSDRLCGWHLSQPGVTRWGAPRSG